MRRVSGAVWRRTVLSASMFSHVSFLPETPSAHVARVRLLASVYLDMIVQSLRPGEGLLAVVALVSTIAPMYQPVLIEDGAGEESLVAYVAFERPLSRMLLPGVIRQVWLYREPLVAVLAGVRLDAHVKALVGPHVARLSVALSADITDVRPQPVVPSLVSVEGVRGRQQTAANVAVEFGALIAPVISHLLAAVEHAPAQLAEELGVPRFGQAERTPVSLLLVLVQQR